MSPSRVMISNMSRNTCSELAVCVAYWYAAAEREDKSCCIKHLLSWRQLNNKTQWCKVALKWQWLNTWMGLSWHGKLRLCNKMNPSFFSSYSKPKTEKWFFLCPRTLLLHIRRTLHWNVKCRHYWMWLYKVCSFKSLLIPAWLRCNSSWETVAHLSLLPCLALYCPIQERKKCVLPVLDMSL